MERSELITISHKEGKVLEQCESQYYTITYTISFPIGRPHAIRPGKPVFYTVFHRLVSDEVFAASMEVETNMALKKKSEADIAKLEDNINKLYNSTSPNKPPREIETRIKFLLTKLSSVEKLIEEYDSNIKTAKEVISNAWVEENDD